jgi:putative hydrolase of the HAD superfamily
VIAAVLFDLDETLLDRTRSLAGFLADQHRRFMTQLGDPPFEAWLERFLSLDARGSVHKREVYPQILAEFGGEAAAAPILLEDYLAGCCRYAQPFEGTASLLAKLRAQGKRTAIVTNGEAAFQTRHVAALGLDALVDAVLISESEGLRKPDARLFGRAAQRLGVSAEHCLFVGDNPAIDILGACDAGMRTAWFRCRQQWPDRLRANPGPTIDQLSEVLGLIT